MSGTQVRHAFGLTLVLATVSYGNAVASAPATSIAASTAAARAGALSVFTGEHIPGGVVRVFDHGKQLFTIVYGVRNLQNQKPVDVRTRLEIGSITKQFTAAPILQLVESRKLSLDDRLATYVPEYATAKDVTIRQLLWHTTGIPDFANSTPDFEQNEVLKPGSFASILALAVDRPLLFAPGTKYEYSNTNYSLLGRIVEVASGMPWKEYVRTHLFARAGMNNSSFTDDANVPDEATGYQTVNGQLQVARSHGGWGYASGGIISTVGDLTKWNAALAAGRIVSAQDYAMMTEPGHLTDGSATAYGMGFDISPYYRQKNQGHSGRTPGFTADDETYPDLGLTIIVLDNNADANYVAFQTVVLRALDPDVIIPVENSPPATPEDAAVTAQVAAAIRAMSKGQTDRAHQTNSMNAALTPQSLAAEEKFAQRVGFLVDLVYRGRIALDNGTTRYVYRATFENKEAYVVQFDITKEGLVAGMNLTRRY